ncbi:unnamed protein product, partial [Echinostoma caproni]|uniref:SH3_10 domain-containing protein n=1 Tax=Echinostoma caproni TaxID=27848 RepID=A0A183AHG1_9TREM
MTPPPPQQQQHFVFDSSSDPSGFSMNSQSVSHYWRVRGINETAIHVVPSVCVWITSPATDAITTAEKLKEELLVNWNDAIDRLLQVVCNFMRQFLNRIIDNDGVNVTDQAALERLLTLLDESYPRYPTGVYNTEIATLLDTVRDLCGRRTTAWDIGLRAEAKLKDTNSASASVAVTQMESGKMHMHKSRKFETRFSTTMEWHETQQRIVQEAHRLMYSIETIHEVSRLDLQRVQQIVIELRRLNRTHWEQQTSGSSVTETDQLYETSPSVTMESTTNEDQEQSSTSSMTIESRYLREFYDRKYTLTEIEERRLEILRQRKRLNQINIERTIDLGALLARPREVLERYTTTTNIQMRPSTDRYNVVYVEVTPQPSDTDKVPEVRTDAGTQTDLTEPKSESAEKSVQSADWLNETAPIEITDSTVIVTKSKSEYLNETVQVDLDQYIARREPTIQVDSAFYSQSMPKLEEKTVGYRPKTQLVDRNDQWVQTAAWQLETQIHKQQQQHQQLYEQAECVRRNTYMNRGTEIKPQHSKPLTVDELMDYTVHVEFVPTGTVRHELRTTARDATTQFEREKTYRNNGSEHVWVGMEKPGEDIIITSLGYRPTAPQKEKTEKKSVSIQTSRTRYMDSKTNVTQTTRPFKPEMAIPSDGHYQENQITQMTQTQELMITQDDIVYRKKPERKTDQNVQTAEYRKYINSSAQNEFQPQQQKKELVEKIAHYEKQTQPATKELTTKNKKDISTETPQ